MRRWAGGRDFMAEEAEEAEGADEADAGWRE